MEEAEVLCHRIGIMARGTLRCVGPLLRLKQLYGSGFKLVFLTKPENMAYTSSCVKKLLPENAVVIDVFQTSMTLEFSPEPGKLASIFAQLEKNADEWLIEDWGISQTSLEEVFLKCTLNWH
jgi:ABC-type multidrug transport system ATPase subunit